MINQDQLQYKIDTPDLNSWAIWKFSDFLEIQSIIGKDRAETLLRSYILHLGSASIALRAIDLDAAHVGETLHDLKSISGQLGFEALQNFCGDALAAPKTASIDDLIRPLVDLIDVSRETALSFCQQPKDLAAGEHSRVA